MKNLNLFRQKQMAGVDEPLLFSTLHFIQKKRDIARPAARFSIRLPFPERRVVIEAMNPSRRPPPPRAHQPVVLIKFRLRCPLGSSETLVGASSSPRTSNHSTDEVLLPADGTPPSNNNFLK